MNSKFLSWPNAADLLKAAFFTGLVAILTGLLTVLSPTPPAVAHFPSTWHDWDPILIAGAIAFISAIIKTGLTNSAGQILKPESTPAAKALTAAKEADPALKDQVK